MYIEKINEDKIRIILNIEDLLGFKTYNYKLIIEAIFSSDGNFVFTITRLSQKSKSFKKINIEAKPKLNILDQNLLIYQFKNFSDICDFCKYLSNNNFLTCFEKLETNLYKIKDSYFLVLENINLDLEKLIFFNFQILEFATLVHNPNLVYCKLKEYGNILIYNSVLETIVNYF